MRQATPIQILELTEIELCLLRALGAGISNKCIARALGKSEFTVRNQLSSLFKKMNVSNRTQAAGWYRENVAGTEPLQHEKDTGTSVPLPAPRNAERITIQDSS